MNNKTYKFDKTINRPSGEVTDEILLINKSENVIKAEIVLNAWLNYCRESRIYRILEWFGLR